MAAFGGLFGKKQEDALARIARFVHDRFGCKIAPPSPDILAKLNALPPTEFTAFESIQSLHGLEAWFHAKSIQTVVDNNLHMIALIAVSAEELASSLRRLIKRTLIEESPSARGGLEFTHTILLFSKWLVINTSSIEKRHR